MDFEDQEDEHEGDIGLPPTNYDSQGNSNSTRPTMTTEKMPTAAELKTPVKPRYKECLKNHAVGIGGHSVDGCGEFMPAGAEGSMDALICAACSCHRNFHRKEIVEGQQQRLLLSHYPPRHFNYTSPTGYLHVAGQQQQQQRMAAPPLPITAAGGGRNEPRDELEYYCSNPSSSAGKKRFRTKFTAEQKEKMMSLADRIGWKMQKEDEEVVQQFCNEVGIKRHVFKVWMHNNKQNLGKKT